MKVIQRRLGATAAALVGTLLYLSNFLLGGYAFIGFLVFPLVFGLVVAPLLIGALTVRKKSEFGTPSHVAASWGVATGSSWSLIFLVAMLGVFVRPWGDWLDEAPIAVMYAFVFGLPWVLFIPLSLPLRRRPRN